MTTWKILGTYLSRAVKVAEASLRQKFEFKELENSVVLVVLGRPTSAEPLRELLVALIAQNPLAIGLFGINARVAFDILISELSDGVQRRHIMTRVSKDSEIEAAVEELLQATWPSEERFDEWTDYAIVNVDGDLKRIEGAVKRICA